MNSKKHNSKQEPEQRAGGLYEALQCMKRVGRAKRGTYAGKGGFELGILIKLKYGH
jgi:hypothetical protein